MTDLPTRDHLATTAPVPTWSQHFAALGGLYDVLAQLVGVQSAEALTIAAGNITPTRGAAIVDTEALAASDDLANIVTTNLPAGRWLLIRPAANGRTVVVKHQAGGAGQISLTGAADFSLKTTDTWLLLERVGADWRELMRAPRLLGAGMEDDGSNTLRSVRLVNAQTGVAYAIVTGDRAKLITISNAAAVAVTLPQAGANFPAGWYCDVQNRGAGAVTITPATSTIDGVASLVLTQGQGCRIFSDGVNYFTQRGLAASTASGGGFRNLIIGGDFTTNPWQRATSFTSISNAAYCADRWRNLLGGGALAGVCDILKTADAPTIAQAGVYTRHCLHVDVTTADASIAAGDYYAIEQRIEGLNAVQLGFGQAGAKTITLSFWHKHTKVGTYCVAFLNSAYNRSYIAEYTQSVSDTWEKATITVPGDTAGAWLYDTGIGLIVSFVVAMGSTRQAAANAWAAGDYQATANQVNGMDSASNNFKLALVQLEVGSSATEFEALPEDIVLARCLRYYWQTTQSFLGYYGSTTQGFFAFQCPVPMRSTPTLSATGNNFTLQAPGISTTSNNGWGLTYQTNEGGFFYCTATASSSTWNSPLFFGSTGSALQFSAEL